MPARTFEATTICLRTNPKMANSKALKISVPRNVTEFLELKAGDALHWTIELASGRITVQKTERPARRRRST